MKKYLYTLFLVIVVVFMLILGQFNHDVVRVHLLLMQGDFKLSTVIAVFSFGGFLVGFDKRDVYRQNQSIATSNDTT